MKIFFTLWNWQLCRWMNLFWGFVVVFPLKKCRLNLQSCSWIITQHKTTHNDYHSHHAWMLHSKQRLSAGSARQFCSSQNSISHAHFFGFHDPMMLLLHHLNIDPCSCPFQGCALRKAKEFNSLATLIIFCAQAWKYWGWGESSFPRDKICSLI